MANSGHNTNGSQFFITIAKAEPLDGHPTIFGQCDPASLFIVRAIAGVPRESKESRTSFIAEYKQAVVVIYRSPCAGSIPLWSRHARTALFASLGRATHSSS